MRQITEADLEVIPPGHARFNELAIIDRRIPLPDVCILSGESSAYQIACLFHRFDKTFVAGVGPLDTLVLALNFYFRDVGKAVLRLPLSSRLMRRRRVAWMLVMLSMLMAILTVIALLWGQSMINQMPAGPDKKAFNDWGIPIVALGGFVLISCFALPAYYLLPTLTRQLAVELISPTHVVLRGTAPGFVASLPPTTTSS